MRYTVSAGSVQITFNLMENVSCGHIRTKKTQADKLWLPQPSPCTTQYLINGLIYRSNFNWYSADDIDYYKPQCPANVNQYSENS